MGVAKKTCVWSGTFTAPTTPSSGSYTIKLDYTFNGFSESGGTQTTTTYRKPVIHVVKDSSFALPNPTFVGQTHTIKYTFTVDNADASRVSAIRITPVAAHGSLTGSSTCSRMGAAKKTCVWSGTFTAPTTPSSGSYTIKLDYRANGFSYTGGTQTTTTYRKPVIHVVKDSSFALPNPTFVGQTHTIKYTFTVDNADASRVSAISITPVAAEGSLTGSSTCSRMGAAKKTCVWSGTFTAPTTPSSGSYTIKLDYTFNGFSESGGNQTTTTYRKPVIHVVKDSSFALPDPTFVGQTHTIKYTFTVDTADASRVSAISITPVAAHGSLTQTSSTCSRMGAAKKTCVWSGTFTAPTTPSSGSYTIKLDYTFNGFSESGGTQTTTTYRKPIIHVVKDSSFALPNPTFVGQTHTIKYTFTVDTADASRVSAISITPVAAHGSLTGSSTCSRMGAAKKTCVWSGTFTAPTTPSNGSYTIKLDYTFNGFSESGGNQTTTTYRKPIIHVVKDSSFALPNPTFVGQTHTIKYTFTVDTADASRVSAISITPVAAHGSLTGSSTCSRMGAAKKTCVWSGTFTAPTTPSSGSYTIKLDYTFNGFSESGGTQTTTTYRKPIIHVVKDSSFALPNPTFVGQTHTIKYTFTVDNADASRVSAISITPVAAHGSLTQTSSTCSRMGAAKKTCVWSGTFTAPTTPSSGSYTIKLDYTFNGFSESGGNQTTTTYRKPVIHVVKDSSFALPNPTFVGQTHTIKYTFTVDNADASRVSAISITPVAAHGSLTGSSTCSRMGAAKKTCVWSGTFTAPTTPSNGSYTIKLDYTFNGFSESGGTQTTTTYRKPVIHVVKDSSFALPNPTFVGQTHTIKYTFTVDNADASRVSAISITPVAAHGSLTQTSSTCSRMGAAKKTCVWSGTFTAPTTPSSGSYTIKLDYTFNGFSESGGTQTTTTYRKPVITVTTQSPCSPPTPLRLNPIRLNTN